MTATYTRSRRSPHIARILCAAFLLLFFLPTILPAQNGGDGDLYFPPKLRIQASTDESWATQLLGLSSYRDSTMTMSDKLVFTRTIQSESIQLLPMIFFDQGSYAIPQRYQTFVGSFDADKYSVQDQPSIEFTPKNSNEKEFAKYYEVLNIIGARMDSLRSSRIELEGGYSTEPGENEAVGKHRADVVKEYFVNVWRIEPERITVLPPRLMCNPDDNALKQEEARRVIIHTRNRELLKTVHYQTSSIRSNAIVFGVTIDPQMSTDEISEIRLIIAAGDKVLSDTKVPVNSDSAIYRFIGLWSLINSVDEIDGPMTAQAVVSTNSGTARGSNAVSIHILIEDEQLTNSYLDAYEDTSIESILFFESSDSCLSAMQEQAIDEQIAAIAKEFASGFNNNWTIPVTAHGDASDNPEVNVGRIQLEEVAFMKLYNMQTGIIEDPSFQMPLYIVPSMSSERSEEADGGDSSLDYMEIVNKILDVWFGDRAGELRETQKEFAEMFRTHRKDYVHDTASPVHSLIINRAHSVAQYLHANLDSAIADAVFVDSHSYVHLDSKYTPEERFYTRSARIRIQHYDPRKNQEWEDEYESYDEYEEEDASEYDSEFDEAQLEEE